MPSTARRSPHGSPPPPQSSSVRAACWSSTAPGTSSHRGGRSTRTGVVIEEEGVTFVASTSPYAPFFGQDELRTLHTIAGLTATALDRVRLFEQEHETRLALERANELMTNFVALAAHELRTPVTTIHGFVQTLNHVGDAALGGAEGRAARSARAADATHGCARRAAARPLAARRRCGRRPAAGRRARVAAPRRSSRSPRPAAADEIEVNVPENASAHVDPQILDHVVTNLVTNAFRYGRAPVRVTATAENGRLRVAVEDSGPGCRARDRGDALRPLHARRSRA